MSAAAACERCRMSPSTRPYGGTRDRSKPVCLAGDTGRPSQPRPLREPTGRPRAVLRKNCSRHHRASDEGTYPPRDRRRAGGKTHGVVSTAAGITEIWTRSGVGGAKLSADVAAGPSWRAANPRQSVASVASTCSVAPAMYNTPSRNRSRQRTQTVCQAARHVYTHTGLGH